MLEGHKLKLQMLDEQMWYMGQYVLSAVSVAVEHCLYGRKAKSEYYSEPLFAHSKAVKAEAEERELTEEEKKQSQEQVLMQLKIMMSNFETSKK